MKPTLAAVLLSLLAACTGTIVEDQGGGGGGGGDPTAPVLKIETPTRGTMTEEATISVTGQVIDDSPVAEVRINDQIATLDGDRFTIELTGVPGLNIVSTKATDTDGNVAEDHRAVLIGELADQGTPIHDGIVARLDATAMDSLAEMVSDEAEDVDYTALATAQNPVVDTGSSCNSAKAYVSSISHGTIPVTADPTSGGIATRVSMKSVVVKGRVTFRALCVSGSANYTITATSYNLAGRIRPTLSSGDIDVALDGVTSGFSGFDLSVGSIPGFVTDLIEGKVRDKIASILGDKVKRMVPPLVNDFLADFVQDQWTASALGERIDLSIEPTSMIWSSTGGRIALETSSEVQGVSGASYLSNPMPAPSALGAAGLSVGLADDVANQLFAGMWMAGAFNIEEEPDPVSTTRAFFPEVDRIKYTLLLPPVVNADTTTGTMKLYIGDVIIDVIDDDGLGTLAKFALSADIDLSATLDVYGRFKVETGSPRVVGQVLEMRDAGAIDANLVSAFGQVSIENVADLADGLLTTIPIPGVGGAEITAPTFEPRGGYVVMGGTLSLD